MEIIVPFNKADFTKDGIHIATGKYVLELQREWEETFHNTFNPYYANVIEGHPAAMLRLTHFMEGEDTPYDFGMELVDDEIDIDTNLELEEYSSFQTVYAMGSQLHENDDEPLFLVKNDKINDSILVLKYDPDDDPENEETNVPVEGETIKAR